MKRLFTLILLLSCLGFIACVSTTRHTTAGVQRSQLLLLSSAQVASMSETAYRQLLQDSKKRGTLNRNPQQVERVNAIARRLIAQVGVFRGDATRWRWEVNVDDKSEINAFCLAGGKIMVLSGLITKLNVTDDELAAVIGHEMAHALREHTREQMSSSLLQQLGIAGLAAYLSNSGNRNARSITNSAALGATLFYTLPNSREYEREADRIGLELAARSGFNPAAAITLWQKMGQQGGGKPPEFLSTHPNDSHRQEYLSQLVPRVMPLYEQAKQNYAI